MTVPLVIAAGSLLNHNDKAPMELTSEAINKSILNLCLGGNGHRFVSMLRTQQGHSPTLLPFDNQDAQESLEHKRYW